MRYDEVESIAPLSLEYQGPTLDLYTLGVLQMNLQEIVDKVSHDLLRDEELVGIYFQRYRYNGNISHFFNGRIVKANVKHISSGSLYEDITFSVLAAVSDSDVRAVLQSLGAAIIFEIVKTGYAKLTKHRESNNTNSSIRKRHKHPTKSFDVGPNIRAIVIALAENGGGQLKIKSKSEEGGDIEIDIEVKD